MKPYNLCSEAQLYRICSNILEIESEKAAWLISIYWITNTIGRAFSIVLVKFISTETNLIISCALVELGMVLMAVYVSRPTLYLGMFLISIGLSSQIPLTFIYTASGLVIRLSVLTISVSSILLWLTLQVFNVENGYMWLFYTGSQLLPMFNPGFYALK